MAVTTWASGTASENNAAELFLSAVSAPGVYVFSVELGQMAAGDYTELRAYQKVLTTGATSRVAYIDTYSGAQPADGAVVISVPLSNDLSDGSSLQFSLKQTTGTGKSFQWKVVQHS